MLKYDSTHGKFPGTVDVVDGGISVDGQKVAVSAEKDPAAIPWGAAGADFVVESTGVFNISSASFTKALKSEASTRACHRPQELSSHSGWKSKLMTFVFTTGTPLTDKTWLQSSNRIHVLE